MLILKLHYTSLACYCCTRYRLPGVIDVLRTCLYTQGCREWLSSRQVRVIGGNLKPRPQFLKKKQKNNRSFSQVTFFFFSSFEIPRKIPQHATLHPTIHAECCQNLFCLCALVVEQEEEGSKSLWPNQCAHHDGVYRSFVTIR